MVLARHVCSLELALMRRLSAIWWCWFSLGCASQPAQPSPAAHIRSHANAAEASEAAELDAIRAVHGGAGPWVVAGYRMGRYALSKLGLARGSFDVEVVHHSPPEVQYSCIADGAAAATGASLGRLTLTLEPAAAAETRTTYRNKQTGASITLATTAEFARRYTDVPRAELAAAGKEVLHLPDAHIFSEVSTP
jgi:formylmethanofuran dehydrogenase subunit E